MKIKYDDMSDVFTSSVMDAKGRKVIHPGRGFFDEALARYRSHIDDMDPDPVSMLTRENNHKEMCCGVCFTTTDMMILLSCGSQHRICNECFKGNTVRSESMRGVCPFCREWYLRATSTLDCDYNQKIRSMVAKCPGCNGSSIDLGNVVDHYQQHCPYAMVFCNGEAHDIPQFVERRTIDTEYDSATGTESEHYWCERQRPVSVSSSPQPQPPSPPSPPSLSQLPYLPVAVTFPARKQRVTAASKRKLRSLEAESYTRDAVMSLNDGSDRAARRLRRDNTTAAAAVASTSASAAHRSDTATDGDDRELNWASIITLD